MLMQEESNLPKHRIAVGKNYGVIPIHYQMNTWASKSGCSYTPRTDE